MASSSPEAIPVKLPIPPSLPQNSVKVDSVAARALAALNDEDVPSSLDVHFRWLVESGSIVQKGEKIAQLFYSFHGSPPPPPSANNGGAIIRARAKNRRSVANAPSAETSNITHENNDALSKENNFVSLEIRSPSNGFLRVLYKKSFAFNAVQINYEASPKYSVINLNLAAIEPCEHPAVVGGLCAVCGADTRGSKDSIVHLDDPIPQKHKDHPKTLHGKDHPRRKHVDIKQQQIIERQKKLAASMTSSKEFDNENDEELVNFDMDAVISSHARGTKPSSSNNAINQAPAPKTIKPKGPTTSMRSLSSLLSGAKATHQLQKTPAKQKQPPQLRHVVVRRPRQTSANQASNSTDPKMSKMTVSGGVTIAISETEAKNISDASSKKLREEKKLCLVLDLDHTLLHATDDYRAGRFVADEVLVEKKDEDDKTSEGTKPMTKPNPEKRKDVRSILLPVALPPAQQQQYVQQKLQQQKQDKANFCLSPLPQQKQGANSSIIMRHFVKIRPHLKEFFSQISSTYQLSVYTAGTRDYAEQVAVMICRHLVGASFDEEGLNSLRSKVREKGEECKKYREYKARVGRKRQLESAKDRENEMKIDASKSGAKKTVSFTGSAKGGKAEKTNFDESGKSLETAKSSNRSDGATNPTKINEATVAKTNNEADDAANDGECTSLPVSASQKRSHPLGDGEMSIPKKKKRVNVSSLLINLPPATESAKKSEEAEEEELNDPSEERDQLRKELEEAEKLEIAAVELRRKMFGSRIVSRTDVGDLGKDVKSLKRVFPCGGAMAAILDDREDVWANANNNVTGRPGEPPDNLLLVKPYHWKPFIGYADVNNASGQDLSKSDDVQRLVSDKLDDKEDDGQLLWTADILRRLHERYYSTTLSQEEREGLTVPSLLQSMRRETFLRYPQVKVVFSGLIPIVHQNKQTRIRPHVVRYAEELGAEVLSGITSEVTHVVAARDRSDKIRHARKEVPGCFIVHSSWLMNCYWSINRRDVRPHHMGPVPSQPAKQQVVDNKRDTRPKDGRSKDSVVLLLDSDEEESDEDEDDFAADLENEMMMQDK